MKRNLCGISLEDDNVLHMHINIDEEQKKFENQLYLFLVISQMPTAAAMGLFEFHKYNSFILCYV